MIVLSGHPLEWEVAAPTAVTVGVFDGVHLGHRRVLSDLVGLAAEASLLPAAVTFHPHPLAFIAPGRAPMTLTSVEQRVEQFRVLGVEIAGVLHFPDIRFLSAEEFAVEVLVGALRAEKVVVGADFRFGRDRGGDASTLSRLGEKHGFEVLVVEMLDNGDGVVSSTKIRALLAAGNVSEASRLLGRSYELDGIVERGDGRGRTIGVPTANLAVDPTRLAPGDGVYAGHARWHEGEQTAVINVGTRPTFSGEDRRVEAHLLGFEGDLYGRRLRLSFHARIRPERKFSSGDELKAQIAEDIAAAQTILASC